MDIFASVRSGLENTIETIGGYARSSHGRGGGMSFILAASSIIWELRKQTRTRRHQTSTSVRRYRDQISLTSCLAQSQVSSKTPEFITTTVVMRAACSHKTT